MKLSEIFDTIDELRIDNEHGWGAVPDNRNVDYKGLRVQIKPSMFLRLAHELGTPFSAGDIERHMRSDGAIGAPFLVLAIPQDWFEGDLSLPAEIYGHEGRNRMVAAMRVEGDVPVEVHLFFGGGIRNRDLTPEIIERLNRDVISQRGDLVRGPWFSPSGSLSEETQETDVNPAYEVIRNAAESFREKNPYDAMEWLAEGGWTINDDPALKSLFNANIRQLGDMVVDEIRNGDGDPFAILRLRDMMEDIGISIPNGKIASQIYNAMPGIYRVLSALVQDGKIGQAIELMLEINEWGLDLEIHDFMDPDDETDKNNAIRHMLKDMKRGRNDAVRHMIGALRDNGIDWPELAAFEKSLAASGNEIKEVAKVRISRDPNDLGAYVHDEGAPEPTVMLNLSDITSVLEPDDYHAEKPGATERIAKMVKAIKAGKTLPPILVRRYKNGYQVLDGHHRFKAYRITNTDQIPARVVAPENITGDIDEAFNNPYDLPKRWKTDSDAAHWKQISLPNNSSLKVQIDWEPDEKIAVWNFWINDKQTITGGGDAFRIFATAIVALQQFVRSKKPNIIAFIGNDEDPSRVKLYDKLVPWLIQKGGLSSYTNLTDEKNWWPDSLWWFFDGLYDTSGKMYVLAKKAWFYKNAVDNEEYDDDMLENFADGKSRSVYESAFNMERYADQARSAIAVGWLDNAIQGMTYGVKVGKVVAAQPIKDLLDENKDAIVTYVLRLIKTNQAHHKANYLEDVVSMLRKLGIDWPELAVIEKSIAAGMNENFADGKGPGRPGDSRRHGIPKHATLAQLDKIGKGKGRKAQLARWQANMRRGRRKTNETIAPHGDPENELRMLKAGTKPAALINPWEFDKLYRPIVDGMGWVVIEYTIPGFEGHKFYVVAQPGERDRAKRIVQLVRQANETVRSGKKVGPDYHRELGFLLGYKKEDIDHFIRNTFGDETLHESRDSKGHDAALTVFDIDETLFHTKAKVMVVRDGEVVRELDNREFNTYILEPGESFDFRQFTDAQFFHDTSVPIEKMWSKARNILDKVGRRPGSRVIIVTARSDFDDKETFLDTFRKHGLDIDKIHVHRAGNLNMPAPSAKKRIIGQYLATGQFDMVRLFDDSTANLQSFLSLGDEYPEITFKAYVVLGDGSVREYTSDPA